MFTPCCRLYLIAVASRISLTHVPLTTLATWVPPTEDLALRIVGDACAAILFLHDHGCHLPALDLASLYVVGATGPPWS